MPTAREVGGAGEAVAERYLKRQGFRVLHRNLRLGRLGELDIVALNRGVLVFIEVKSCIAGDSLGGFQNITATKQSKLIALGNAYLQRHGAEQQHNAVRFDAVEVEFADARLKQNTVRHIADAFRS